VRLSYHIYTTSMSASNIRLLISKTLSCNGHTTAIHSHACPARAVSLGQPDPDTFKDTENVPHASSTTSKSARDGIDLRLVASSSSPEDEQRQIVAIPVTLSEASDSQNLASLCRFLRLNTPALAIFEALLFDEPRKDGAPCNKHNAYT